ncbi:TetR family transcriptional regulator [Rhodococcus sp. D2-41]|uniref:TetR family transcriptional regulator n=1 Tax=Speluncibacter jeojiensis TaxID=2710754 RepID=A0A9X4RF78_9ACTN|nr:TetR family transcriptional regulator [Rhodococcus sp. D2-41]MDG3011435.1 TetR family transcriptional regulator [Rhodococcus sp. D2-41]MDG3016730.1 TetR family transcriptional regulator [Corynebacteriales bacterium D3-21]
MRRNEGRRVALVDAAIEVLAREGARGLTFRAVDAQADVPTGTASNYFANRDAVLIGAGMRVYERLKPDDEVLDAAVAGPRDRAHLTDLMRDTVRRVAEFRTGHLALLELRLEATRRPELQTVLTERVRQDLDFNIANHLSGRTGDDATTVVLLYMTLNWLILDRLTLPELFSDTELDGLVIAAVERIAPR